MNSPYYLKDQRVLSKKRPSPAKNWFAIIVLISLGLNVYFLFFQDSGPELAEEKIEDGAPAVEVVVDPEPVNLKAGTQEADSPELKEALPPILPEVRHVAYSPVREIDGQEVRSLQLKVRNSLTFSICNVMTREEGCEQMSAYMSRLLSWFFDIGKDVRNGDSVTLVYQKISDDSRFRILQLSYESNQFKKTFVANYFTKGEKGLGAYYDGEGVEIARRIADPFAPVRVYHEITSLPGDYRKGPIGHAGTDFKTEVGTPVFSSFAGRVTRTNWNVRSNGYCLELDHPQEGVKTLYLHLSRVLVKPGRYVTQGEKIAETGNTGRSFAPHLHYEIKSRDDKRIVYNPFDFKYIKTFYGKVLPEEWERFQKTVRLYDSILQNG